MKTLFLLVIASLCSTFQLFAQDPLSVDTLVAYFSFSGNAEDSSGFENHGEVFGATLTEDRFGNANSAYEFDGFDDYVEIPNDQLFNSLEKTISFWFKKTDNTISENSTGNYSEGLLFKSYNTGIDRELGFEIARTNPPFNLLFSAGSDAENKLKMARKDMTILSGVWYQVTGVIDSTSIMLFLDGQKIDLISHSGNLFRNNAPIVLGKVSSNSLQEKYFNGVIDDLRIYNYALEDSVIKESYYVNDWSLPQDSTIIPENTLVAYFPFNGDANDSSGFENNGEVFGATLTEDRFGTPNSAYEFDGFDDYLKINDTDQLSPTGSKWSISVWFKAEFPGDKFILYKGSSTSNREYASGVRLDSLGSFQINENGSATNRDGVVTSTKIKENTWNHLVGVWDSSYTKIYLNNKLENIDSTDLFVSNLNSDLYIGTYGGGITQYAFNGKIDDLRLYNSALDSSLIDQLYRQGGWPLPEDSTIVSNDTLAAYYPFNGDASDSSGYGNHAEVFGAELTKDRFGREESAYHFDGIDDFIEVSNPEMLHSKKNLSVSFWAKGVSKDSAFVGLISKSNMQPFGIAIDNGNSMLFSITDNRIPLNMVVKNLSVDPNKWYQYVAVFNAGEYMRLFQNGTEVGTLYGSIPARMDINSGSILFGATEIVTEIEIDTLFFEGDIDDIRFYNYDLTSIDVSNLYIEESKIPINTEPISDTPQDFKLYQNYPNPFNPSTTIKFDLPVQSNISLKVYDITGRLVANLAEELKSAGSYQFNFDASGLASGIYIYELRTDKFSSIKKFTLIK